MLTGSPKLANIVVAAAVSQPNPSPKFQAHNIPPIKSIPKKNQSSSYTNCYSPMNNPHKSHNNNSVNGNLLNAYAKEKAIKEKGFYLHPSPAITPRKVEPRLLHLFPVTSPRVCQVLQILHFE
ncbi:hypothetical protein P3X46_031489 [Hevea brasiliensis]|uniref:Uncharacterized protein n=1 Tax=Hevea brasiliensis TaxID=3981 RepID=A0ABQ9KMG8_HEVBR|nr:hypothetical protein P3X46_031489 [Hevea brasiliensis]